MLHLDVEKILSKLEELETNEVKFDLKDEEEKIISVCFHLFSRDDFEEGQLGYREDPVLTAEHGMGEWEPSVLYDTLEDFVKDIKKEGNNPLF